MALPTETEASYAAIIDSILATSDLNTISAKRVRKGLQAQVDYDITPQKDAITTLILARFDKFNETHANGSEATTEPAEPAPTTTAADKAPTTNGVKASMSKDSAEPPSASSPSPSTPKKRSAADADDDEDTESSLSSVADPSPPKKKAKKSKSASTSAEDADAAFAARLQAEENSRRRTTRGGGSSRKAAPAAVKKGAGRKKQKMKSAKKVGGDDDSDVGSGSGGGEGGEKKEVKRTGGFHKPMTLSPPLSELLGETSLSRPQTVKKIWEYVKAHDLQDPSDKRQIRCDDGMRAVFKQDRVHMFTMNKILNQNLYAQDE